MSEARGEGDSPAERGSGRPAVAAVRPVSPAGGTAGESIPLTGGRLLARNSVLNLVGLGLPLLVALAAIPLLIQGLGTDRFGVLTLAWIAIGYFSVFDLGLGRALTQLVADRIGRGAREEIGELVWTAQILVLALGGAGGVALAALTPWLVGSVLQMPAELTAEARTSFLLLALALPWVLGTTAWRGYLEAEQRFGLINAIRVPLGVLTYAGPLAVLPFSNSLVPVVAVLVTGRVIAWVVHLALALRVLARERRRPRFAKNVVRPLLRFGSWMTVSNVISPIMVYLDRFLIGALLSMAAVAYYVTPYEVVTRLWLIPSAFLGVAFPAFAASFGRDARRWSALVDRSARAIFVVLFPVTLLIVTFAYEGLHLWVGEEFASQSYRVLRWLAVGVFVNCIGQVAFAAIQGAGRPDVTAKLHLAELPVYALLLWWLLQRFGIEGVAMAWTARVVADTVLLMIASQRLSGAAAGIGWSLGRLILPSLAVFGVAVALPDVEARLAFAVFGIGAFTVLGWWYVLTPEERTMIRTRGA